MTDERTPYEPPSLVDFGTLAELTEATSFTGPEDGASKLLVHHDDITPMS